MWRIGAGCGAALLAAGCTTNEMHMEVSYDQLQFGAQDNVARYVNVAADGAWSCEVVPAEAASWLAATNDNNEVLVVEAVGDNRSLEPRQARIRLRDAEHNALLKTIARYLAGVVGTNVRNEKQLEDCLELLLGDSDTGIILISQDVYEMGKDNSDTFIWYALVVGIESYAIMFVGVLSYVMVRNVKRGNIFSRVNKRILNAIGVSTTLSGILINMISIVCGQIDLRH